MTRLGVMRLTASLARWPAAGCLAAALITPAPAAAQTPYTCGMGTLRDVDAVTEVIPTQQRTEIRPDGKDYKVKIVRAVRTTETVSESSRKSQ